jgi:3'(2'), 5'-bisphosphate nucleotidase
MKFEKELLVAKKAAMLASVAILKIYKMSDMGIEIKSDESPVTRADLASDKIIRDTIHESFPTHSFLTEETDDDLTRLEAEFVWIIDPIDGTKDFIAKNDQFTINIALCHYHELVVGLVMIPATNELYYAIKDEGSYYTNPKGVTTPIHVNSKQHDLTALLSRFHTNEKEMAILNKNKALITKHETWGSSIKPCRIAKGLAEITYRCSDGTKEWDTAAPDIIVREAGGIFVDFNMQPLVYNRVDVYNRNGYIAANLLTNIHI